MGFFSSLKGQLGRDTGRVITNKVYGNRHASKYQRVDNTKTIAKNLKLEQKYELELLEQEKNYEIDFLKKKEEIKNLQDKKVFVDQNLKKIIGMKVPNSKDGIIDNLHSLSVEITSNKWKDSEDEINKISNIYTDALFKKYEQHLFILKNNFPNSAEIIYFEKQYKTYQKQAFLQKYKLVIIGILLAIVCGIGMYFEKDKPKETPIKDFFKSLNK
jgi:uncharacterized protein (DUF1919 family)